MHHFLTVLLLCFLPAGLFAQEYHRWDINEDGSISWRINGDIPHNDHIEMSGKQISCVLRYGVGEDGSFHATRSLVWPMLRTIPNNTHASLKHLYDQNPLDLVMIDGQPIPTEKVNEISRGILAYLPLHRSIVNFTRSKIFPRKLFR